jgi:hypothetical protein
MLPLLARRTRKQTMIASEQETTPLLSILVPVYNEGGTVDEVLRRLGEGFARERL